MVIDENAKWVAKHEATTPTASVCMHTPIVLGFATALIVAALSSLS